MSPTTTTKSVPDKHSPGPWIVDPVDPLNIISPALSTPPRWEIIAKCSGPSLSTDETGKKRALADARLIAAAPDLLEALRQMTNAAYRPCGHTVDCACPQGAAKSAIAKAEGKDE